MYRRQLSVPLFDMENTYAEYQQWLTAENLEKEKSTVDAYNKALSKLQQIQVFEDRLVSFYSLLFIKSSSYKLKCPFKFMI